MVLMEVLNKAYAKTTGETIREHTDKLLKRLEKIKEIRGEEIIEICPSQWREHFWELASIVIEYHDYGKLHSAFQAEMIKRNENLKKPYELYDTKIKIPHNFLSPCFIDEDIIKNFDRELLKVVIQAIAYHHDREIDEKLFELLINTAENDLGRFKEKLFLKYWKFIDPQNYINPNYGDLFKLFVLLKGLLHRLDYTASSDIDVEIEPLNMYESIRSKLEAKGYFLNEIQEFVLKNSNKDLLLIVAPTGSGKTEAGAIYVNNSKGFFVLPLRVSINSIYDRLTEESKDQLKYGIKNVGLVHSTSIFKLLEKIKEKALDVKENTDFEQILKIWQEARNLSFPFSVITPDQLFPFVFRYPGFERVYFTLGYSKVVIDEIQMYNPKMLAYILKGIHAIRELGGKVMLMTATLPKFLEDNVKKFFGEEIVIFKSNIESSYVRHYLKIENKHILDENILNEIAILSMQKKVLVICNTVNTVIKFYEQLKCNNKFLLHSRFLQKHRKILEENIQKFAPNNNLRNENIKGVWITTQLVEVSLDVDFDILYTELSSIDSLIQRMGRVNRSLRYTPNNPNVIICYENCSGIGKIYDRDIFERSRRVLKEGELREDEKISLIERVYSTDEIKRTNYYEEFEKALDLIDEIWRIGKIYVPINSLKEAQRQFREILTVKVIPQKIYKDMADVLQELYIRSKNFDIEARKQLLDYTLDIPYYYLRYLKPLDSLREIHGGIYIVPWDYDFDENINAGKGLCLNLDESNLCD